VWTRPCLPHLVAALLRFVSEELLIHSHRQMTVRRSAPSPNRESHYPVVLTGSSDAGREGGASQIAPVIDRLRHRKVPLNAVPPRLLVPLE